MRVGNDLLRRRVVTAPSADTQALFVCRKNLDRSIATVLPEIRWLIGKRILAAEFILNLRESIGYVPDLEREERSSASGFGNALQNLVPFCT